jgi:hypothetical protein
MSCAPRAACVVAPSYVGALHARTLGRRGTAIHRSRAPQAPDSAAGRSRRGGSMSQPCPDGPRARGRSVNRTRRSCCRCSCADILNGWEEQGVKLGLIDRSAAIRCICFSGTTHTKTCFRWAAPTVGDVRVGQRVRIVATSFVYSAGETRIRSNSVNQFEPKMTKRAKEAGRIDR